MGSSNFGSINKMLPIIQHGTTSTSQPLQPARIQKCFHTRKEPYNHFKQWFNLIQKYNIQNVWQVADYVVCSVDVQYIIFECGHSGNHSGHHSGINRRLLQQYSIHFWFVCQQECFVGQQGKNEKTRSEVPEVKKRKNTSSEQSTDTYKRLDRNNQSDLKKPSGLKVGAQPSIQVTLAYLSKRYQPM